jgi:hypothetical protein
MDVLEERGTCLGREIRDVDVYCEATVSVSIYLSKVEAYSFVRQHTYR